MIASDLPSRSSASGYLPTAVPVPVIPPTPLPDEQAIVDAVMGQGDAEHWAAHVSVGSFTAPGSDERIALAGNIGDGDEVRWVVIGRGEREDDWRLLGVSGWLGSGFEAPPSFYLPPDLVDFDHDNRQELLSHYSRVQWGWTTAADVLYRWDGGGLARVWRVDTVRDNTMAGDEDVAQPYRENYRAEWQWADLDGDGLDEIVLEEHVTFQAVENAQAAALLGEQAWGRAFHWDGKAFRPYAPEGPSGTFAYTTLGSLWLWQDHVARPLGVEHVREFRWSPDGAHLAWWGKPPPEEDSQEVELGVLDVVTETYREFSLVDELIELRWIPDGRLVYTLPDQSPVVFDPATGRIESLPTLSLGTWSPRGDRVAYEREGSLYVYDFSASQERPLVVPPEGAGAPVILPSPEWSPRGDWIAYCLSDGSLVWVGLVSPHLSEQVSGFGILETFDGLEAPGLDFFWSPEGSRLAVLASDPMAPQSSTVLYVADLPFGEGRGVGLPDWRTVVLLEAVDYRSVKLAWSPDGEQVSLAAGNEILEVDVSEEVIEPTLRRRFAMPELEWTTLEWAPDGSGFVAGVGWVYDEHLYWFPADGTDPVLLVAGSLESVCWSPQVADAQAGPGMVLVEYTDDVPLLHFLGEGGSDVVVPAKGAESHTVFQIGGDRVYYNKAYADRSGGVSLFVSDVLAGCRPPLVDPAGGQLAWLCDDGVPDWPDIVSGTAEIHFRLIVTDDRGRHPREVWNYVEAGPDYRDVQLIGWREDGGAVYLSRPKYGTAWAYFDYNPGIVVLELSTGEAREVGDLEGVHDGAVSPDGAWLVQSRIGESPNEQVVLLLRSLVDGTERTVSGAEGAMVAGDFSFAPDNAWLAWREWATAPGGSIFLIRVLQLPDGEPITVYGEAELTAPQIGGWIGKDDLILVYPPQQHGAGGYSTIVNLPAVGKGDTFSPFAFLGVLSRTP